MERVLYYCSLMEKFLLPLCGGNDDKKSKKDMLKEWLREVVGGGGNVLDMGRIIELICVEEEVFVGVGRRQRVRIPAPSIVRGTF